MKTKEELNALKEEVETLNKKLAELSDDELVQVSGDIALDGEGEQHGCYVGFFRPFGIEAFFQNTH